MADTVRYYYSTQASLIIQKENMFDPGNENIILCSKYLSHALDVNALHVFQLKEYVLKHLIIVNSAIINEAKALFVQNTNYPDKNCKCVLTFSLRSIFSVIPTFPQQQYEFTFKEVCDLLICTVGQTAQEAGKLCPVGMSFVMLCNFFHHKDGQNFVTT